MTEMIGGRPRKLKDPVILYARIEAEQNEALERIAEESRLSKATIVRDAIDFYIAGKIIEATP